MKRLFLIIFCVIFALPTLLSQERACGYVFEDDNRNGKKERWEKGIPGVAVSNSEQVALTDKNGYYELPVSDDNIIFVVKPRNYIAPVNGRMQPQYYYIHKPNGANTETQYPGVAPTGRLPKQLNFPLLPYDDPEDFRFLAFGDPQLNSETVVDYFKRGIVDAAKHEPNISFGISLGDLVWNDLTFFSAYLQAMDGMGMRWYNVPGNHDVDQKGKDDRYSCEAFEANIGPANTIFCYGRAHFILLDDVIFPDSSGKEKYIGGFRTRQLNLVENYLSLIDRNDLVILSFHIPLFTNPAVFRTEDRLRLLSMLKDFPNVLALSGHTHVQNQFFYGPEEGWRGEKPFHEYNVGTSNGDWYSGIVNESDLPDNTMRDGTPQGYAVVGIKGNKYEFDYRVAGKSADYAMRLVFPKVVEWSRSSTLYVNFFIGSKNDRLECRIDEGEWLPMAYAPQSDPYVMRLSDEWYTCDTLPPGKKISDPVASSHLWKRAIRASFPEGEHLLEVRAVDMFGRTHTARQTFRVVKR